MVLFPMEDLRANFLLHAILKLTSKMVFWLCIFSPFWESDVIIGHVITKMGVVIQVHKIYFVSKIG